MQESIGCDRESKSIGFPSVPVRLHKIAPIVGLWLTHGREGTKIVFTENDVGGCLERPDVQRPPQRPLGSSPKRRMGTLARTDIVPVASPQCVTAGIGTGVHGLDGRDGDRVGK